MLCKSPDPITINLECRFIKTSYYKETTCHVDTEVLYDYLQVLNPCPVYTGCKNYKENTPLK